LKYECGANLPIDAFFAKNSRIEVLFDKKQSLIPTCFLPAVREGRLLSSTKQSRFAGSLRDSKKRALVKQSAGTGTLLQKLLKFLGLRHQIGGEPFQFLRGNQMGTGSRQASTNKGTLAKIFNDVRNHVCVVVAMLMDGCRPRSTTRVTEHVQPKYGHCLHDPPRKNL
jgi:hypothetical protein